MRLKDSAAQQEVAGAVRTFVTGLVAGVLFAGQQAAALLLTRPPLETHTHITYTLKTETRQFVQFDIIPCSLTLLLQRRGRGLALPHKQETETIFGHGGQGPGMHTLLLII